MSHDPRLASSPSEQRRLRAGVLAWILGASVAVLAATAAIEIEEFHRLTTDLADRTALLERAHASRTLLRTAAQLATKLETGTENEAGTLAATRDRLRQVLHDLRAVHGAVIEGEVEPGRRVELPTAVSEVYFGAGRELDRRVRDFVGATELLVNPSASGEILGRASPASRGPEGVRPILDRYDDVIAASVKSLEGRTKDLRSFRYAELLAGPLLLVGWIALLYQWMLRQLRVEHHVDLELRTEAEGHARELAATLEKLTFSRDEARSQSLAMLSILEDLHGERARLDHEVSERTRAEERFRSLVEASPVGEVLVGPTGTIRLVNPVAARMFGYARDELVGQPVEVLVPSRARDAHPDHRASFLKSPTTRPMGAGRHLSGRRKDGSEVPIEIGLNPILTEEGPSVLTSILDITQRDQAERAVARANRELSRKNEELEQFVYTVSHDLKSPMVTISGFVGHLTTDARALGHPAILDAASRIERACGRLGKTLDDLLELSRAGRTVDEPKRVDVRLLVEQVIEQQASWIEARHACVEIAPKLPVVDADSLRLGEVLDNLVTNAIRYGCDTPLATIRIGGERAAGEARIFVEDEGPGIAPEFQERVFGLFFRLSANGDGSGVGLAIVKRIVEAHGGRTWIESPPAGREHGTRVWIALPDPLLSTWQRRVSAAELLAEW